MGYLSKHGIVVRCINDSNDYHDYDYGGDEDQDRRLLFSISVEHSFSLEWMPLVRREWIADCHFVEDHLSPEMMPLLRREWSSDCHFDFSELRNIFGEASTEKCIYFLKLYVNFILFFTVHPTTLRFTDESDYRHSQRVPFDCWVAFHKSIIAQHSFIFDVLQQDFNNLKHKGELGLAFLVPDVLPSKMKFRMREVDVFVIDQLKVSTVYSYTWTGLHLHIAFRLFYQASHIARMTVALKSTFNIPK